MFVAEGFDDLAGLGADIVAQHQAAQQVAAGDPDLGKPRVQRWHVLDLGEGAHFQEPVAAAQEAIHALMPGAQALAGERFELGQFELGQLLLFAVTGDGTGQGMRRKFLHRVGQPRQLRFPAGRERLDLFHPQLARGQRAGLVEGNGSDSGEFFDGGATAEEDAVPGAPRNGRQHRRGDGQDQGAGRGHDQQGQGMIERAMTGALGFEGGLAKAEPPDKEHDEGKAKNEVGVGGAEAVGKLLGGGFLVLGLANEADDFLEGAFRDWPKDAGLDGAPEVHGARKDEVAPGLFDRRGVAGQVGFVAGGPAVALSPPRELGAGFDQEAHARAELFDGTSRSRPPGSSTVADLGASRNEGTDFALGSARRNVRGRRTARRGTAGWRLRSRRRCWRCRRRRRA